MTYSIIFIDEYFFVVRSDTDTAVSSWSTEELAEKEVERLTSELGSGKVIK